jgi:Protein of unknown function (DUF3108)
MYKLLILFILIPCIVIGQDNPTNSEDSLLCSDTLRIPVDQLDVDSEFRYVENNAFGTGEKLTFTIGWKMVKVGEAVMEVNDVFDHQDRPVYKIRTLAKSFPFFDSFFQVRDTAESWIDVEGLFTWRFRKALHEGNYDSNIDQDYDQTRNIVYSKDTIFSVPKYVQDVLSALYYVRALDLNIGDTIFLDNFSKINCYPLEVIVHAKEIIEVPAGKFKCIKVEPLLKAAGIFKHEGTLSVWLTDDRLKMPVLMKSKVLVGSIYAELTDYSIGELYEWE